MNEFTIKKKKLLLNSLNKKTKNKKNQTKTKQNKTKTKQNKNIATPS